MELKNMERGLNTMKGTELKSSSALPADSGAAARLNNLGIFFLNLNEFEFNFLHNSRAHDILITTKKKEEIFFLAFSRLSCMTLPPTITSVLIP